MSFSQDIKEEINKLKVWDNKSNMSQEEQIDKVCIREAFLKSGSMSDPNKEYHLEIVVKKRQKAQDILDILLKYNIKSSLIKRRTNYIIYLKDGEEIARILAFMGANSSVLRFEEVRVVRDMRNTINRKVNCETANLTKTVNASLEQIKAIETLKKNGKLDKLDNNLKEIAVLRVQNPELGLEALGQLLVNPISKSGVNHRLKKIIKIANER